MTADLVVFGEDWGLHPSSTQHIVRRLASRRRVVWMNSIGMRRPRLRLRDLARASAKAASLIFQPRPSPTKPGEPPTNGAAKNVTIHPPMAIPLPASSAAFQINRRLLGRQVRGHLAARGIERPILWTSLPTALPVIGEIGERAVVYYCGDDFGALDGVDHEPVLEMEKRLVDKADLVIAASDAIAARFPSFKTHVVHHGADIDLFSAPALRSASLPSASPCAGFYGSISDWLDVALLAAVAHSLPDWHFVLVGPVKTDVRGLAACANVTLVPAQQHRLLPGFAQHWDVSLAPFRDTPQIRACNPLKLREYLAAGTPIAATDFPALAPYRDLIAIGQGLEGFRAAILEAASDRSRNSERMSRVAGETWEARAADVSALLDLL